MWSLKKIIGFALICLAGAAEDNDNVSLKSVNFDDGNAKASNSHESWELSGFDVENEPDFSK